MHIHEIRYSDGQTPLTGRLVSNRPSGKRRGIMVVHGGAGLDAHAEDRAQSLASVGDLVFACDMYGDEVPGSVIGSWCASTNCGQIASTCVSVLEPV